MVPEYLGDEVRRTTHITAPKNWEDGDLPILAISAASGVRGIRDNVDFVPLPEPLGNEVLKMNYPAAGPPAAVVPTHGLKNDYPHQIVPSIW
ncbi:MAG: hypothetical protein WBE40_06450 [Thermoplasmata archaeon]